MESAVHHLNVDSQKAVFHEKYDNWSICVSAARATSNVWDTASNNFEFVWFINVLKIYCNFVIVMCSYYNWLTRIFCHPVFYNHNFKISVLILYSIQKRFLLYKLYLAYTKQLLETRYPFLSYTRTNMCCLYFVYKVSQYSGIIHYRGLFLSRTMKQPFAKSL